MTMKKMLKQDTQSLRWQVMYYEVYVHYMTISFAESWARSWMPLQKFLKIVSLLACMEGT